MTQPLRAGFRAAGIIATLAALAGVAFMLYSDAQVAGSVVARPLGWIAPAVAVLALAGMAAVLLGVRRSDGGAESPADRTRCPSCEREVPGAWRMCPYCGEMAAGASESGVDSADQVNSRVEGDPSWLQ